MAKALIVQSDYLSRLQSDHTVIFTFRNGDGPQLMVPLLHEVTANWRDQRSKGKVTKSLKQTLIQYVTSEIITRVTTFADDKNAQAKAQEMGWVTSDLEYNYLDWSTEEQRLVPRQEGTLTQVQVLADARRLKALLKEQELIIKFSAARNAQPNSASETATFHLGALATDPSGGRGHGDLSEVVCLINSSASVTSSQAGPPRAVAVDQGDSGGCGLVTGRGLTSSCVPAIPQSLATVVLHNPGNHCYLNSTVYLLAYACYLHAPHGPPRGATTLERAVHTVLAHPGEVTPPGEQLIAELPVWRSLLADWHNLHQQQDAMELLHHLLERNPLPFAHCQWEARPIPGTAAARRPLIRGTAYVAVPLPRSAHATLQDCVVQWHEQKIPHGLLGAPPVLFVNLARYANIARGKNPIRLPCKAMQKVSFPVFRGTGHDVAWTSYTLVAGVMHLGPQPQSGHYRSFLAHPGSCLDSWPQVSTSCSSEPQLMPAGDRGSSAPSGRPSAPSGSRHYTWWCTDDGKAAEVCHPTYYRTLSENCYVLCFCLTEHLNTC